MNVFPTANQGQILKKLERFKYGSDMRFEKGESRNITRASYMEHFVFARKVKVGRTFSMTAAQIF